MTYMRGLASDYDSWTTHWAEQDGAGEIFFHTLSARKATRLAGPAHGTDGRSKSRIIVTVCGTAIDLSKPWRARSPEA